jgi:hypothetical protein
MKMHHQIRNQATHISENCKHPLSMESTKQLRTNYECTVATSFTGSSGSPVVTATPFNTFNQATDGNELNIRDHQSQWRHYPSKYRQFQQPSTISMSHKEDKNQQESEQPFNNDSSHPPQQQQHEKQQTSNIYPSLYHHDQTALAQNRSQSTSALDTPVHNSFSRGNAYDQNFNMTPYHPGGAAYESDQNQILPPVSQLFASFRERESSSSHPLHQLELNRLMPPIQYLASQNGLEVSKSKNGHASVMDRGATSSLPIFCGSSSESFHSADSHDAAATDTKSRTGTSNGGYDPYYKECRVPQAAEPFESLSHKDEANFNNGMPTLMNQSKIKDSNSGIQKLERNGIDKEMQSENPCLGRTISVNLKEANRNNINNSNDKIYIKSDRYNTDDEDDEDSYLEHLNTEDVESMVAELEYEISEFGDKKAIEERDGKADLESKDVSETMKSGSKSELGMDAVSIGSVGDNVKIKQPPNAFLLFGTARRKEILKMNTTMTTAVLNKILMDEWNAMNSVSRDFPFAN